jgi:Family of unknown function (DUF6636)
MRRLCGVLIAAAVVLSAPAGASAGSIQFFKLPSGNIGCASDGSFLRCDIGTGLVPRPPRPPGCDLDWGFGLTLGKKGRAKVVCAGDTVLGQGRVLAYGRTWSKGAFSCTSTQSGLTCVNARGRGFFLSRQEWHRIGCGAADNAGNVSCRAVVRRAR